MRKDTFLIFSASLFIECLVRRYILSSIGGSYIYLIIFCFMKEARRDINWSFFLLSDSRLSRYNLFSCIFECPLFIIYIVHFICLWVSLIKHFLKFFLAYGLAYGTHRAVHFSGIRMHGVFMGFPFWMGLLTLCMFIRLWSICVNAVEAQAETER
jgi:hypothetical protein